MNFTLPCTARRPSRASMRLRERFPPEQAEAPAVGLVRSWMRIEAHSLAAEPHAQTARIGSSFPPHCLLCSNVSCSEAPVFSRSCLCVFTYNRGLLGQTQQCDSPVQVCKHVS